MHIVHTEASRGWGGQEIRILTEAEGMIRRGHRVTLLCPNRARIFTEAEQRKIPVVALPIGRKRLRGVLALRRWLRATPVDVINTHSSTDTWLVALASLLLERPPSLVRTRHISASVPKNRLTRWLYQKATTHIVTTGEKLRLQLAMENGYDPATITSVPTGMDIEYFVPGIRAARRAQLHLDSNSLVIGIVATLRSWKGHEYLVEAFSRLSARSSQLVILGDGPQREALRQRVQALGLQDRVFMQGDQRDVLPWLQAMDIFVLPSYANEGVPQAIMQAMLCALPVVTTPIGSIGEIVTHDSTGLMVKPKDADDLWQALEKLAADASLRNRLGAQARQFALAHFGLDPMLDKMEKIFAGAMAASRR
ncbi:MAG: glycosyltransferase family 4 protein [Gammaproteobacteria bacterium]|nr:glycosyltransferase family 4 protein [Gammaproteobacteria bacterium]